MFISVGPSYGEIANLDRTEIPEVDSKHQRTLKIINHLVQKSHFRSISLNDSFSEQILDAYLKQLDPNRSFFLQADVDQFLKIRHQFDDYIKRGDLEAAFAIFRVFRTRVEQRIEFALERVNAPLDFTIAEDYLLDRSESDWPESTQELNDIWRKRIKNDILNLRLANKKEEDIAATLERRYTHIARRTRQFKSDDVFQSFTNAYVNAIEPHTSYFSPRASENFKINMRLSLEGIGAVLQTDNEYTQVRRVVPGGPADIAGELKAEDRIVGVGQGEEEVVDVIGWRLDDVVELIRGPKATVVKLEILPGEAGLEGESEVIEITRDEIKLEEQAAKKEILEVNSGFGKSKIGLIDLPSFYVDFDAMHKADPNFKSTTRDVRRLLKELESENIDGLVIDLRGNGGGALTEAIALTGLFIQQGPVVQVENSGGSVQVDRDPDPEIVYDGPLAVLVDGYSASASEIFAGAIQDYRRGIIIGEPTFGKGTVQNLVNLNRFARNDKDLGQLKVTIAQFFRINGDSTQFRGVTPDLIWPTATMEPEFGERSYENAIPWRHIRKARFRPFQEDIGDLAIEKATQTHKKRIAKDPEFQFLIDATELNQRRREVKTITLHEVRRRDYRAKRNQERLDLENNKRHALGEEPFSDIDDLDTYQKDQSGATDPEQIADAMVMEAARILGDYLYYLDPSSDPVGELANVLETDQPVSH